MCVCLCVSMCVRRSPALLEKSNLRGGFGLDFGRADAACEQAQQKCRERIREEPVRGSTRLGIWSAAERRLAIDQNHVAADAE